MPQHIYFRSSRGESGGQLGWKPQNQAFIFTRIAQGKVKWNLTYGSSQTGDLGGNRCHHQEGLRAHGETGTVSAIRKHTQVSLMNLFWHKPRQPNRLEKESPSPLCTLDLSPMFLPISSSPPYTKFLSSIKILLLLQDPAHMLPFP